MKTFAHSKTDSTSNRRFPLPARPILADRSQTGRIRRILDAPCVQPKLEVGPPNDEYEREADRVADQVMRMPDSGPDSLTVQQPRLGAGRLQRMCTACLDEDDEKLRPKAAPGGTQPVTPDLAARIKALRGGGRPLPVSERAFFEPRFSVDLSGVRIHDDAAAGETARALQARAFTYGRDIVFAGGGWRPNTGPGRRLLAHELVHIAQQCEAGERAETRLAPNVVARDPEPSDDDKDRADAFRSAWRGVGFLYQDGKIPKPPPKNWYRITYCPTDLPVRHKPPSGDDLGWFALCDSFFKGDLAQRTAWLAEAMGAETPAPDQSETSPSPSRPAPVPAAPRPAEDPKTWTGLTEQQNVELVRDSLKPLLPESVIALLEAGGLSVTGFAIGIQASWSLKFLNGVSGGGQAVIFADVAKAWPALDVVPYIEVEDDMFLGGAKPISKGDGVGAGASEGVLVGVRLSPGPPYGPPELVYAGWSIERSYKAGVGITVSTSVSLLKGQEGWIVTAITLGPEAGNGWAAQYGWSTKMTMEDAFAFVAEQIQKR